MLMLPGLNNCSKAADKSFAVGHQFEHLFKIRRIASMEEIENESNESKVPADVQLGILLGRRQAFSLIAGRCSAADAAGLREIRNQKSYKSIATNWTEFCSRHLGMSHTHANRLIGYLDEFGPEYFELTQLTGVTVEAYRAIAPAVKDQALHYDGQAIALLPENAERLAEAVQKLRNAAAPEPAALPAEERVSRLERRLAQFAVEINALAGSEPPGSATRMQLASVLRAAREKLQRLELAV
jgi:hypothetical protein